MMRNNKYIELRNYTCLYQSEKAKLSDSELCKSNERHYNRSIT